MTQHQQSAGKIDLSHGQESAAANRTASAPKNGSTHALLALHRIGNQAVGRFIQTKLKVSSPKDEYEQEADRVADQVMRMADDTSAPVAVTGGSSRATVQRACASCEAEEDETTAVHRKAANETEEVVLHRKKSEGGKHNGSEVATQVDRLKSGGEALPPPVRNFFEPRFGRDFSEVRVHYGGLATETARQVNALAYTLGNNIVFAAGQYAPDTSRGKHLLAHELAHTVQQGSGMALQSSRPGVVMRKTIEPVLQRQTARDEEEFAAVFDEGLNEEPEAQTTPPNPTASAPPSPVPVPTAPGTFDPLTGTALSDRQTHGLTTDTGPMTAEIEQTLFPTGGSNPACVAIPANFETTVATALSSHLRTDLPTLTPSAQPDPMALATETAGEAMPIIASYYSPHAPTVSAASFMTHVSRKTMAFGNPIRTDLDRFASFVSWYAGTRSALRALTGNKCNLDRAWWRSFVGWLDGAGATWNANPHRIRERCALYNTFFTSTTRGGQITFGLGFTLPFIPHTVVHEAMHLFQSPTLRTQINLMQQVRASTDMIIEGFAEYLARGVRDQVVNAIQAHSPPPLSAGDEARARTAAAYPTYFSKAVELRDILYRHGQDGEESLRRAFFLGEGWRFGLLESAGMGSPIETDRPLPGPIDVHFNTNSDVILDPAALNPIVAYVTTRSIARVEIIGRTDPVGTDPDNVTLGQRRADSVQAYLVAQGIDAARITTTSHGETDQVPGGRALNRRATVTIIDARNEFPGTPAVGRP